jgi:hypothetical protein
VIGLSPLIVEFMPFYWAHGMDLNLMIEQLFVNHISSFFALDLLITATVALPFMIYEARKIELKYYWLAVISVFAIGLSFGLPLFLYLRERHLVK